MKPLPVTALRRGQKALPGPSRLLHLCTCLTDSANDLFCPRSSNELVISNIASRQGRKERPTSCNDQAQVGSCSERGPPHPSLTSSGYKGSAKTTGISDTVTEMSPCCSTLKGESLRKASELQMAKATAVVLKIQMTQL